MRLIDADALSKSVLEWLPSDPCGRPEAEHPFETDICVSMLMEIEDAPTIDAVEVVRCKDCAHYNGGEVEDGYDKCWYHWTAVEASDYCSYGVRGEDGEA